MGRMVCPVHHVNTQNKTKLHQGNLCEWKSNQQPWERVVYGNLFQYLGCPGILPSPGYPKLKINLGCLNLSVNFQTTFCTNAHILCSRLTLWSTHLLTWFSLWLLLTMAVLNEKKYTSRPLTFGRKKEKILTAIPNPGRFHAADS
jgi:hypothetical protein